MRRSIKLLSLLMALIMVLFSVFSVSAGGAKEDSKPAEFKMGFMTSLSGSFAAVGETQKKGTLLAAEEVNAKGGLDMPWGKVKIETLVKDDEAKLDVGVRRFRELVGAGINGLTGTVWNPMSAAINEETKIAPLPYLAGNVPALDSFRKGNPAVGTFSVAFTPWSIGYLAGASAIQELGAKKIFFVSRADSWGSTIFEGLKAAIAEHGGEVVGFAEYPLGTVDFSSAINKALEIKPDVFMACQFGGDAIAIFKQAYDMGLHKQSKMFNTWTTNVVGKGIPSDALKELYALNFYYYNLEGFGNPELEKKAKAYTEAHMKMWNEPPDAYGTISYMAAKMIFESVEKAGTFDPVAVAKVMKETTFDTVKGKMKFREDQQLVGDYLAFIVKGKSKDEMKDPNDVFKVIGSFGGESALPSLKSLGY
ncbi:MAG: ABC transporter substrate-binding protein [Spirochaetia bacterium]|jgi:branched-chain amino acid transport system substrate-binding protein|nr:ABC transporter substrate-binding protein [Spirochaetia bacterium]